MTALDLVTEISKAAVLAACIEDGLVKSGVPVNRELERVFCLVDLLESHLDTLMDKVEGAGRDAA